MFGSSRYTLSKVTVVVEMASGGLYQRIDENRKLVELLRGEAPELLSRFPRIEVWLRAQDQFLLALESAVPANPQNFVLRRIEGKYPRPWPATGVSATRSQTHLTSAG